MTDSATDRRADGHTILNVRSMTKLDLELLRERAPPPAGDIKLIRQRHHHIAWLVALGRTNNEIAAECRMSPARVSQLKASPSFQDLIAVKTAEVAAGRAEAAKSFEDEAGRTLRMAEQIVQRDLEAAIADPANNKYHLRDINRIAETRMDRFGFAKTSVSKNLNVNVNFAANLEAAIARSRKAS